MSPTRIIFTYVFETYAREAAEMEEKTLAAAREPVVKASTSSLFAGLQPAK
jgi:hypothetical protein